MLQGRERSNGKQGLNPAKARSAGLLNQRSPPAYYRSQEGVVVMNCQRSLIISAIFLILGLGLIFGFTHGTAGFSAAYPVSGTALDISLKTTGLPAMAGLVATLVGLVLLIVALVQAVVGQVHWPAASHPNKEAA
jgi:uncharacterized membrane protein